MVWAAGGYPLAAADFAVGTAVWPLLVFLLVRRAYQNRRLRRFARLAAPAAVDRPLTYVLPSDTHPATWRWRPGVLDEDERGVRVLSPQQRLALPSGGRATFLGCWHGGTACVAVEDRDGRLVTVLHPGHAISVNTHRRIGRRWAAELSDSLSRLRPLETEPAARAAEPLVPEAGTPAPRRPLPRSRRRLLAIAGLVVLAVVGLDLSTKALVHVHLPLRIELGERKRGKVERAPDPSAPSDVFEVWRDVVGGTRFVHTVRPEPVEVFDVGLALGLVHVPSPGAAWGRRVPGGATLLNGLMVSFLIGIAVVTFRRRVTRTAYGAVAWGLFLGGCVANAIERLYHGVVTNWIDLSVGDMHWPIFQFADTALTLGFVLGALRALTPRLAARGEVGAVRSLFEDRAVPLFEPVRQVAGYYGSDRLVSLLLRGLGRRLRRREPARGRALAGLSKLMESLSQGPRHDVAVRTACDAVAEALAAPGAGEAPMRSFYAAAAALLADRDVAGLARDAEAVLVDLRAVLASPAFTAAGLRRPLAALERAVAQVALFEQAETAAARRDLVGAALAALAPIEALPPEGLPEHRVLGLLSETWTRRLSLAFRDLQESAHVVLRIVSAPVELARESDVVVRLENLGPGAADGVEVHLEPDETGYEVVRGVGRVALLGPGATADLPLVCRPLAAEDLSLRVRLVYGHPSGQRHESAERLSVASVRLAEETDAPYRPIENPFNVGKPATGRMFFGREDLLGTLLAHVRSAHLAATVVVRGQRRFGKSSLLRQLAGPARPEGYAVAYVDLQGLEYEVRHASDPVAALLRALAEAVEDALAPLGQACPAPPLDGTGPPPTAVFRRYLKEVAYQLEGPLLLLLDEFDLVVRLVPEVIAPSILGYLRSLMQAHERIGFVVAGTAAMNALIRAYEGTLFNQALHLRVSFLDRGAFDRLLTVPLAGHVRLTPAALDRAWRLTRGQPHLTQLLGSRLVMHANEHARGTLDAKDVNAVRDALEGEGRDNLEFLWSGASAGERKVLYAVAALMRQAVPATPAKITAWLAERGVDPPAALPELFEGLRERDLLERVGGAWQVTMALAAEWLVAAHHEEELRAS
jgi:lipoprotein signal peptidase